MATKKKPIAKSASVEKNIAVALERLDAACTEGDKAVAARSKIAKKLNAESRRLNKKRATLVKRSKVAALKAKADPSAANRKALREAVTELAATRKALAQTRAAKAVNSPELAGLKVAQRQANAYGKAIVLADKVLNKPKKKRKKRAKKAA
jgi:hypothetical protein